MRLGSFAVHAARCLAATCIVVATAALPAAAQAQAPAPARAVRTIAPATGGFVVGIDRETGMLVMPSPEQMQRLLEARARQPLAAHPAPVLHADGHRSLDVHAWMREFLVAGRRPDGRLGVRCVSGAGAVTGAQREAAAPAALEER